METTTRAPGSTWSRRASLKLKAIVFISLMILAVGASVSWYCLTQTRAVLTQELQKRALSLAQILAHDSKYGVLTEDEVILQELIRGTLHEESVLFVVIADTEGKILAQQGRPSGPAPAATDTAALALQHAAALAPTITGASLHYHTLGVQAIYHAVAPVETTEVPLSRRAQRLDTAMWLLRQESGDGTEPARPVRRGSVQVLMSLEATQANIRQTFAAGIGLTLGTILIGVLVSFGFCNYVLTPVQDMARAATRIAAGDLSQRVPLKGRDEIGLLAESFNHMAASLSQMTQAQQQRLDELSEAYQQIEQLNVGLESKVEARTEELRLQQQELRQVNTRLEIANRHKSEFLANMSHELRTPLNAIIGFSDVLIEKMFGDLNAQQEEYLNDILSSGQHLLSLINDILDLSKVEAGKMEFEPTVFDLRDILEGSLVMVKERAMSHGIGLSLEMDEALRPITGDERKVKQILFNLLSNAVKFTPARGKVGIVASQHAEAVHIAVWDTGIGIAPEDQPRIFDEFQQVGHGLAGKTEGTGLGLTLTKKFVELHGGTLQVESTPGHGSTFTFTLPYRVPESQETVALYDDQSRAPHRPSGQAGPLVLVIEDDPKAADLLRIYLHEAGYTVEVAHDGEVGLQKAKQLAPVAVILDVLLPQVDGWAFLSQIKAEPATRGIPVVITSIVDQKGKGFALGAAEYLIKPVHKGELLKTLAAFRHVACARTEGARILVIDDDPRSVDLIAVALEPEGWQVLRAYDGDAGIALAEREQPALIILDILMPEMDGFAVLERLQQSPVTRQLPVIIYTVKQLTSAEKERLKGRIERLAHKTTLSQKDVTLMVKEALERTLGAVG